MNLRVFPYYTIDHPLKGKETVIISNRMEIAKTRNQVYAISKNPLNDSPRLVRVLISGETVDLDKDSKKIRNYEQTFKEKEKLDFYNAKMYEIMRFTRSLLIAYILYLAPESFWSPIVALFNMIAHGLSDYARWCIIAFFPIKAVIRSFGSLIYIQTKGRFINIGFPGRWHQIHQSSKTLELFDSIDDSIEERLNREISILIKNMKDKENSQGELIGELESLFEEIWHRSDYMEVNRQIISYINKGEKSPLWGEMVKLNMLRKELIYFLSSGVNNFSTIQHFNNGNTKDSQLQIAMAPVKFQSYISQSENLTKFKNLPLAKQLKSIVLRNQIILKNSKDRQSRLSSLEKLTNGLERLRDEAGRFHMGHNQFIPNEKGNDIALFYHNLYTIFGEALCDLENKYRRAKFGIIPIISEKAQRRRIKRLFTHAEIFIEGRSHKRSLSIWRKIKSIGGMNLRTGLATSAIVMFAIASLLSFYWIRPGDTVVQNDMKIGYMGQFINNESYMIDYGEFLTVPFTQSELGWHFPKPLSRHEIINNNSREISLYMIMGEYHTANPISNLLSSLSGQLGTRFDVIQLKLKYIPKKAETWSLYNIDNRGDRRLLRDLSELTEEWRSNRGIDLTSFTNDDFEQFFRELSDMGVIEDYLTRSFSQTAFSTNIYYGSLSERFDSGFDAVQKEFRRKIEVAEINPLMDISERELMKQSLIKATEVVDELQANINEQVKIEYSELRSNPEMLNKLVKDPYNNIQKLKDFETLWLNISNYVQYLYRQKQIMEILSTGYIDLSLREEAQNLYPQHLDLADFLQGNEFIKELIEIQSINFEQKSIGLTEFTQYQEKWKETI